MFSSFFFLITMQGQTRRIKNKVAGPLTQQPSSQTIIFVHCHVTATIFSYRQLRFMCNPGNWTSVGMSFEGLIAVVYYGLPSILLFAFFPMANNLDQKNSIWLPDKQKRVGKWQTDVCSTNLGFNPSCSNTGTLVIQVSLIIRLVLISNNNGNKATHL